MPAVRVAAPSSQCSTNISTARPRAFGVCAFGTGPYSRYGPTWSSPGPCERGTWAMPWWDPDNPNFQPGAAPVLPFTLPGVLA